MYVWFDALTNYITAIGFGNEEREEARLALRSFGRRCTWSAKTFCDFTPFTGRRFCWQPVSNNRARLCAWHVARSEWTQDVEDVGNTIELDVLHRIFDRCDSLFLFARNGLRTGRTLRLRSADRSHQQRSRERPREIFRAARLTMIARYCDSRIPSGACSEDKLLLAKRTGVDTDETTVSGFIEHARDQFLQHFENLCVQQSAGVGVVDRRARRQDDLRRETVGSGQRREPETDAWRCLVSRRRNAALAERAAVSGDA
jgi:hypothetical protein